MENPGWYQWLLTHLPLLEFLSLLAIALGVFAYFVEATRSRKAAQRQTEDIHALLEESFQQTRLAMQQAENLRSEHRALLRPGLVLLIEQSAPSMGEGKLALQRMSLKNIGLGAAFNIRLRSFQYQEYQLEFDPLDFVEKDKTRPLGFVASAGGHYSGLSRSLILLESALLAEKNAVISEIPLEYSYDDAFGQRYRTSAVLVVDHMSGKITMKYPVFCAPE
jgi:hypothetical protein